MGNGMLVTPLSKIESRSHRTTYEAKVVKGIRGCHEKTFIKLLINSHEDDCPITLNNKHVAFGKYIKIQGEDTYSVHCSFIQLASDLPTYATNYIRETSSCCPNDTGFDSCCSNDITCGGEMGLFCSNPARPLCVCVKVTPKIPHVPLILTVKMILFVVIRIDFLVLVLLIPFVGKNVLQIVNV